MVFTVEIRTRLSYIREFDTDDADELLRITGDADVTRFLSFSPTSLAEARALVDFALVSGRAEPRQDYVLAVEDVGGRLVGACGFHAVNGTPDEREVFFVLRRDRWGRGIAGDLLDALLDFGFRELDLTRIFGVAHPDNVASIRVMERAGMTYDGEAFEAFEGQDGWRSGRRYAILRREPSPEPSFEARGREGILQAEVTDER